MIIKIKSKNRYLLDVLNKNPNTDSGLYMRQHANGVIVGNCVSKNEYECVFIDNGYSFTNYFDNQLDFKSLSDSRVVLKIVSELFSHLFQVKDEDVISWLYRPYRDVDSSECAIHIENLMISSHFFRNGDFFLSKYIHGIKIVQKSDCIFSLDVSAENIRQAVNKTALVAFFIQMSSQESLFPTEELLRKYIKILYNVKDTPYFIYYLLCKRLGEKFGHLVPDLEKNFTKNSGLSVKFTPNSTQEDRMEFVESNLNFSNSILDFGCNQMDYFRRLYKNSSGNFYSYDREDYSELYEKIKAGYTDSRWLFTTNIEDVPKNYPLSCIMSEVIEHNQIDDALNIVKNLLNTHTIKQLIITTPNIAFNRYYNLETLRHDDHVQELTRTEFQDFVIKISGSCKSLKFVDIGDVVAGEPVTFGVVINYV